MQKRVQAKKFAQLLKTHFGSRLISVVLFGSVARGDARPDSDVDLIVVIEGLPEGRLKRRSLLDPVLAKAERKGLAASFNCHLKTPDEAREITVMYFDLPFDAEILFDREHFFARIIAAVKKKIKKMGAVRKKWGKFYYWDLKPGAHAEETFDIL